MSSLQFPIKFESWSDLCKQLREAAGIPTGGEITLAALQLPLSLLKSGGTLVDPKMVSGYISTFGLSRDPADLVERVMTPSDKLNDEDFSAAGVGIFIGILNLLNQLSLISPRQNQTAIEQSLLELLRPGGVVFEKCLIKAKIFPGGTGYISNGIANYLGCDALWTKDGTQCYRKALIVGLLESWGPEIARLGWTPHHDISAELELGLDKNLLLFYLADEISAKFLVHAPVLLRLQLLRQF